MSTFKLLESKETKGSGDFSLAKNAIYFQVNKFTDAEYVTHDNQMVRYFVVEMWYTKLVKNFHYAVQICHSRCFRDVFGNLL